MILKCNFFFIVVDNSKAYATLSTTHIFFNYVLLLLYLHYVLIIDHRNIIVIDYYSVQILKNLKSEGEKSNHTIL